MGKPTMGQMGKIPWHCTITSLDNSTEFWIEKNLSSGLINMFKRYTICPLGKPFWVNTLRLRQNGCHFPDDIFKCIFLNENVWIPIKISLKFVPKGTINNIPAMVQIMAWRRPGNKPLSEPMVVSLPTHICVAQPQWVKWPNAHDVAKLQILTIPKNFGAKCVQQFQKYAFWPMGKPIWVKLANNHDVAELQVEKLTEFWMEKNLSYGFRDTCVLAHGQAHMGEIGN